MCLMFNIACFIVKIYKINSVKLVTELDLFEIKQDLVGYE
jgi:hypothetical protein